MNSKSILAGGKAGRRGPTAPTTAPPAGLSCRLLRLLRLLWMLLACLAPSMAEAQGTNCCDGCAAPFPASVTVTVFPGFNYLVNPLCHGPNNFIDEVLPIVPDETQVYKWNKTTQNYGEASTYVGGIGWVDPNFDPSVETLPPGEGFVLFNPTGAPFSLTFRGCLPACPLPCGPTNGCCLVGRYGAGLAAWTNLFSCPPACGVTVRVWNPTNQLFCEYTYLNSSWTPQAPVLDLGTSAFVCAGTNTNCVPCELPVITHQPADQTVADCTCVTFSVVATGVPPLSYQWFRNGVPLPGATGISFTVCPVSLADDGSGYMVVVANDCGSVTSRVAILHVTVDVTPPAIASAGVDCASNKVTLVYSEPVDPLRATDPSNYSINGGAISIVGVTLLGDGRTVCLFTAALSGQAEVTVVIDEAVDLCGNAAFGLTATARCPCLVVRDESIACSADAVGYSSYEFEVQNNTGVPVKFLFLVPEDDCLSIVPDVVTFAPPLPPGGSARVSVLIRASGACASNHCFTLSAHDSNLVQCCSIKHCARVKAELRIVSAVPTCGSNKITVAFSSPLDPATALDVLNYLVDDLTHLVSIPVAGASFGPDLQTVCLFTAAPLAAGTSYQLTVNNVRDACGDVIADASRVSFSCADCVPGATRMTIELIKGQVVIAWTGGGRLQCADEVVGPWSDVPGATNPYTAPVAGARKFYRVVCP